MSLLLMPRELFAMGNTTRGQNMSLPKLRFSEFWDNVDWEEIKLIDVTDKKIKWSFIGGPFGSNLKSCDYTPHGIRIIQLQNIGDAEFIDDSKIFTTEQKANELLSCNIYPDEIILSKMGDPVGRACLIPNNHSRYLMCSDGIRLVVDEQLFSKYFIYSLINSDLFRKLLDKTATGSTRKRIGLDDLKNLPMVVPKLKEQQKIADCLSSISDRITLETQKLDTLKTHKKGLMQQLFPAEGETLPKLRFPEFRDAEEWQEEDLSKLSSCGLSNGVFNDPKKVGRGYKLVNVLDMYIDTAINEDNLSLVELSREAFLKNKVKNGDLFFTRSSLVKSGIAYSNIYLGNSNDITFDGHLIRFRTNKEILIPIFINYLLRTNKVRSQLVARGKTATMTTIGQADVGSVKLSFPHINEQQKIADCLSSLDELIAAQAQAIDTLKTHKKGLMQQLFPSVDEVKG